MMTWDEMEPDERDRLVAEAVMGDSGAAPAPPFTRDIDRAWRVVERVHAVSSQADAPLRARFHQLNYDPRYMSAEWMASFVVTHEPFAITLRHGVGTCPAEAICIAALRILAADIWDGARGEREF